MNDSTALADRAQEGIASAIMHDHVIPLAMFLVLKCDGNRVSVS